MTAPVKRAAKLLLFLGVLFYFNSLLTYKNVVATPWVELVPQVSIELIVGLALVASYRGFGLRLPTGMKTVLGVVLFGAFLLRYVDLTALGVMGRDFNLHADTPHVHRVAGMFWEAMPVTTALLITATLLVASALVVVLNVLGYEVIEEAMGKTSVRWASFISLVPLVLLGFQVPWRESHSPLFSQPVTAIVGKQLGYLIEARQLRDRAFPATDWSQETFAAEFPGLGGANVLVIFLESYGTTLIEDPHHFSRIAPRFADFERRLETHGLAASSNKILSPTFAGGSWRAQASFLSGIRISNEHFYNTLLESDRKTLVHLLRAAGYRTVTAEPGIQRRWPDGEFFEYDKIYDAQELDYRGAPIGWWKIPDQYTLYKIYQEEIRQATQPLFAKFALIMSHIPYFPIPPYVDDWSRFDHGTAFDRGMPSIAADDYRDLNELSSRYVQAFVYELDILEDFVVDFVPRNSLIIVLGDHQPPKLATHNNDSWAVPIHLISGRPELIEPFHEHGFRAGLVPHQEAELSMEEFLPAFIAAFHSPAATPQAP